MIKKRDPAYAATCDVCGEPIYEDEEYYEMPDTFTVCADCLTDWAEGYRKIARRLDE